MASQSAFDVIVIGGGHAGAEAAWAAAKLGARVALLSFQRAAIGRMSCNPAIGGIGKGQMVREIDALGGLMGRVADETGIQFRMLNRSKGPAVWAPRCQSDSAQYPLALQRYLADCPNLTLLEASVEAMISDRSSPPPRVVGVWLADGRRIRAGAVIVTSGTFLRGLMHCGEQQTAGGRIHEPAAGGLSASLAQLGLRLGRLKTGTPPRVARDSVDFSQLAPQPGDESPAPFSFMTDALRQPQVDCWIGHTNEDIHALIRANLHRAPMYSGQIESRGPRYCPSIEDKVVRFADKPQHQVYLEPEGRDSERVYLNGVSTSLPQDVQERIVRGIAGLERARVVQWGYAVEYDFVPPEQIDASLMAKAAPGLFLAGQINGTSGYEEAAGQGLLAGTNAARFLAGMSPLILGRNEAYVGVMIDDLVTRGVTEPYRMFTSRAEHRLLLRYDNADERLTPIGRAAGLIDGERWARFERRQARLESLRTALRETRIDGKPVERWLRRPEEQGARFAGSVPALRDYFAEPDLWARALVEIKYAGYVERQQRIIDERSRAEGEAIPCNFDYQTIRHLRREAAERWGMIRPHTVGQAARVSGIHPTDVSTLMVGLAQLRRMAR